MDRKDVKAWLDDYVEAWRTYDSSTIGNLFSEDAQYLHSPFDENDPVRGRKAIVANWIANRDVPDSWEAHYEPIAVEGNIAVTQGRTRYLRTDRTVEREYANIFILEFDEDGRCRHFTEMYMKAIK